MITSSEKQSNFFADGRAQQTFSAFFIFLLKNILLYSVLCWSKKERLCGTWRLTDLVWAENMVTMER